MTKQEFINKLTYDLTLNFASKKDFVGSSNIDEKCKDVAKYASDIYNGFICNIEVFPDL